MDPKSVDQSQDTDGASKASTLDLVFGLVQDSISFQMGQVDTLDTKANSAQVAATALVSAALVLQAALLSLNSTATPSRIFHVRLILVILLLPLLIVYGVVIYFATKGYGVSEYDRVPEPKPLLGDVDKGRPVNDLKRTLLTSMETAFYNNEMKIRDKARNIKRANIALGFETLVLLLVLLLQAVSPLFIT